MSMINSTIISFVKMNIKPRILNSLNQNFRFHNKLTNLQLYKMPPKKASKRKVK